MSDPSQGKNSRIVDICAVVAVLCVGGYVFANHDWYHNNRPVSRVKTVTNNLRILTALAGQYMLDKGVSQASYTDIVGTGTEMYIRSISPVAGEDYSGIVIHQTDTQISIANVGFGTVSYNR